MMSSSKSASRLTDLSTEATSSTSNSPFPGVYLRINGWRKISCIRIHVLGSTSSIFRTKSFASDDKLCCNRKCHALTLRSGFLIFLSSKDIRPVKKREKDDSTRSYIAWGVVSGNNFRTENIPWLPILPVCLSWRGNPRILRLRSSPERDTWYQHCLIVFYNSSRISHKSYKFIILGCSINFMIATSRSVLHESPVSPTFSFESSFFLAVGVTSFDYFQSGKLSRIDIHDKSDVT